MAVVFRAIVMISVLVGLPTAWVYYGPLPKGAQQVVDRAIEVAKHSLGWQPQPALSSETKTAPRYQPISHQSASPDGFGISPAAFLVEDTIVPTPHLPGERMAEASPPRNQEVAVQDPHLVALARELEPHFSLLQKLGAEQYSLSQWGNAGDLYRFQCEIALEAGGALTRQFEAIDADPLATVRQVVGEVTSWQNARGDHVLWK